MKSKLTVTLAILLFFCAAHATKDGTGGTYTFPASGWSGGSYSPVPAQSNAFFAWDVENVTTGALTTGTSGQPFNDINLDNMTPSVVNTLAHSGSNSVCLTYSADEQGVYFNVYPAQFPGGVGTQSLYTRKWEYYDDAWQTNIPVGLKTSRYFAGPNADPLDMNYPYMSEKLWQGYEGDQNDLQWRGVNNAIGNMDLEDWFATVPAVNFNAWNKIETWMVLNTGNNVADGVLQMWINDVLVVNRANVPYWGSSHGRPNNDDGWKRMWFGGNYSGATFGAPTEPLLRCIDDFYLSTTLDR